MNYVLMEQIIRHVMSNLGVVPSSFVDLNRSKSLRTKEFLLNEKLKFELETGVVKKDIWGCQINIDHKDMKILLGDCTQQPNLLEFCVVVQLQDAPAYGLYIIYNDLIPELTESEPLLAVTLNSKDWMECNTYLQGTFLAGMEQIRDLALPWTKAAEYSSQYELMLSFIKYHDSFYEVKNEGQEN